MDFGDSPHPDIAPLLQAARKEWINTLLKRKASFMRNHPELDKAAILNTMSTKERARLWWKKKDTLYRAVGDKQDNCLPRKGEHELAWRANDTESRSYAKWGPVNEYISDSLRGSKVGWRTTQLNALQVEIYRLNRELFPKSGPQLLYAIDLSTFREEAEGYWKDKHPQYMALSDEIDMLQQQFMKLAKRNRPDFCGAYRGEYPGITLRDLFRQQFYWLCGATPDYEMIDVGTKREKCKFYKPAKWTRKSSLHKEKKPVKVVKLPTYSESHDADAKKTK